MDIRIAGITDDSIVDGPGFRFVVFTQGCPHHCPGCHNPQTHDFSGGRTETVENLFAQFQENPLLSGVTFSGGEPFCQPEPLCALAKLVHGMDKNVVCYSGWTLEQLTAKHDPATDALLNEVDILIDGPFKLELLDLELNFRGSSNQRVIDMAATRAQGKIVTLDVDNY